MGCGGNHWQETNYAEIIVFTGNNRNCSETCAQSNLKNTNFQTHHNEKTLRKKQKYVFH